MSQFAGPVAYLGGFLTPSNGVVGDAKTITFYAPSVPMKYGDIPYWIASKVPHAIALGLDKSPPMNILDIGTGCAHLLAVANALGHRSVGIDVSYQLYDDVCAALGIDRRIIPVKAREKLPGFGMRFDLITAIWTTFNNYGAQTPNSPDVYWGTEEWDFFLRDLRDNHANPGARVYLELNQEWQPGGKTVAHNKPLHEWFRQNWGGVGEDGKIILKL